MPHGGTRGVTQSGESVGGGGAGCDLAEVQRAGQRRARRILRWRDRRGSRMQRLLPRQAWRICTAAFVSGDCALRK